MLVQILVELLVVAALVRNTNIEVSRESIQDEKIAEYGLKNHPAK